MKKIALLLLLLAFGGVAFYLYIDTVGPEVEWNVEQGESINEAFKMSVSDDKGLKDVCFTLSGGSCSDTKSCSTDISTQTYEVSIDPEKCADGSEPYKLKVTVSAVDTSLVANKIEDSIELTYDTQAPNLVVLKGTRYMKRGGAGVVLYEVDEDPAETGVLLDDLKFGAHEYAPNKFLSFYVHPYYIEPDAFKPRVFAIDEAGNLRKIRPGSRTSSRTYRFEEIDLSDEFLEVVKDKMMPRSDKAPLDVFVDINNNIRQENRQRIKELCSKTEAKKLWEGNFLRNQGATRANFADARTYKYRSETVDQQVHTGMDIAGVNMTPIVAANHGKVVFAGEIGIYGNVIILDHGYGIHSLYGHLSQMDVQKGDSVRKGDPIALSGETGLAFGDHLHFEIRANGFPVNPIEWFDEVWVANNIEPFLPGAE